MSITIQRRKTRIVCISDTHNQTPKLPKGDILIHAGDLTNQGSYSELKKTVAWLERQDFEAVIVVAGNHDTTLDAPFFYSSENKWKWPSLQDPVACRKLLTESKHITYLENETATIYLTSPTGPRTCLRVFGSPCSPGRRGWAFQYWGEEEAEKTWAGIGMDVDVVVTHTPAYGFVDSRGKDGAGRTGCEILGRKLEEVRPLMSICGHIHSGRGVERVRWRTPSKASGSLEGPEEHSPSTAPHSLVEAKEVWTDPGRGNNKISIVDLTLKSGHPIDNTGRLTRHVVPDSLVDLFCGQPDAVPGSGGPQPGKLEAISTSSLEDVALRGSEAEGWTRKTGGAVERRSSDIGRSEVDADAVQRSKALRDRHETAMINAAFLGPRNTGPMTFNKPIVVDVELPVWEFSSAHHVQ
ncbi:Metallo-dependent phosphatase-like protein [Paraphoma chrysanthemicola]|uniref:Metallo-dependent phosphatase-like protein n=1 Tax=Paraphoma chrysanthemicola TaxID=798071 RepID=A0A8K0R370_9PLEO|nr:Metallo-dependent phosphatase-like protein [Paraphoma chrysanthemicola]